ncbi:MAG: Cytochrome c oxidase polypeptide III, partial [uncultured Nocardioidaceae bacterium]
DPRVPPPRAARPAEHGERRDDHLAGLRADVLRRPVRRLLHDPRGLAGALGAGDREAQRAVRLGQHHHPGALLPDLPARRLRSRARPGRSEGQHPRRAGVGAARVVRPHLRHGRGVHRRPGAGVHRAHPPGAHVVVLGVRLRVLPHHRLPRPPRHRRADRLPLRPGAHLPRPQVHPRAGRHRDRRVVLLALRRRRVDRPFRDDLPSSV